MLRIFISVLGTVIFLLSSPVAADENGSGKAEIRKLFKSYKSNLQAGDAGQAMKLAEQLYALTPEVFGKRSKTYATVTFNLAQAYDLSQNYIYAIKYYRESLGVWKKLKLPKDKLYLHTLELLSEALLNNREGEKAVRFGIDTLVLAKKLKVSQRELAEYELNLGRYYFYIHVNWDNYYGRSATSRHFRTSIKLFSKSYGINHVKTADAMYWLGRTYLNNGQKEEAKKILESTLRIYKEKLTPDAERIVKTYVFLIVVYEMLHEKDKVAQYSIAIAKARPSGHQSNILPLYKVAPIYPRKAFFAKKQGYVIVKFTVNQKGEVESPKVIETTDEVFNRAAVESVLKFRYAPSIIGGVPVKTDGVLHKVTFEIIKR